MQPLRSVPLRRDFSFLRRKMTMGTPSNTMTERETYDQMVGLFLRDHPEYLQQEGAVEQRWLAGEPEPYLWLNYETSKAFLRWGLARDLIPPSHQPRAYALLSTT